MTDSTESRHAAYRAAILRFNAAVDVLRGMADRTEGVAKTIRGKGNAHAAKPSYSPGVSTWPDDLPTAAELRAGLDEWHEALAALKAAHEALGKEEQALAAPMPPAARDRPY